MIITTIQNSFKTFGDMDHTMRNNGSKKLIYQ